MLTNAILPITFGAFGMIAALLIYVNIIKSPAGEGRVKEIADEIHLGAMVFMASEYKRLAIFCLICIVALYASLGADTAISFTLGALCSGTAGYIGMYSATKANVRTAVAANTRGAAAALNVAFFGGSIMGLTVASMGLLGIGTLYFFMGGTAHGIEAIEGFAMGGSSVALFSRVGGGIFTKSADVGADLVGKVEAGIPEDDPRNPAVIADNVGDNVGDVAGMGSDIFESYCGAMIASIALAASMSLENIARLGGDQAVLQFMPLALASLGLLCSLAGIFAVKLFSNKSADVALRFGTIGSAVIFIGGAYFLVQAMGGANGIWVAVLVGAIGGIVVGLVTEYYTGGAPVRKIAKDGETGPATVMISGLATGMQSVAIPVLTIAAIIYCANEAAGLYGVGLAAVGMLSTVGITMAIDAYGPVADNAGGIAEMANMGKETREITDSLDEVGNSTAAIGKGFAISAAALAALALISAYIAKISNGDPTFVLAINDPMVLCGMFIGGIFPFLVSAMTMTAVGDAAFDMIVEVRRQFKEIPGLLEGTAKPDTARCVDIATRAALRKMILPGSMAVLAPVVIGFGLGPKALGGMLAGALVCCVMMALMMANAGGAWDNAKKYVEKGNLGGKGSDVHKAAVVGDTVGDPLKDTSGPAMNILINVMAIVSLVIAPLLV
ncbi:sodium-translocating pyrophosphatase [Alphaproteobacteria bacterium]|jgi:K(+)-stimulated pyrophosphate-energized sodium pump|nr:sodium-translocating pyrophosphatase [Alphaproteobacteria bacterium]MDA9010111.1 sodium-translocating pyrophosphatase [bacterium]MDA9012838.1 sodium-translocating pyrophosphatase [Alphaproteobacteria bacterium]MDA9022920.1 sodium-translocating pyrophosphatase [Alphaproteobacteria bacterium]MDA9054392.1 sodium-translocating pyrophosphatase [Alphaproteobacteria bacterium]